MHSNLLFLSVLTLVILALVVLIIVKATSCHSFFRTCAKSAFEGKAIYYAGTYASDLAALQPYTVDDAKVIALAYYGGLEYAIYVNPADKRGYRSVVRYINNRAMKEVINRPYTVRERAGLHLVLQLVEEAYSTIVPIVQTAIAGNNTHQFDEKTGVTIIGKPDRPSLLHGHVWGRGNPCKQYIEGVPLAGPRPGLNFDMMAKTPGERGNDKKVPWTSDEIEKVVPRLRSEIERLGEGYDLTIVVRKQ